MSRNQKKFKNLFPKPKQGNEINYNKAILPQSSLTNYTYSFLDNTNNYVPSFSTPFVMSSSVNSDNSFTSQSLLNTAMLPSTSIYGNKAEALDLTSKKSVSEVNSYYKNKPKDKKTEEVNIDSNLIALAKSVESESFNSDSSGDTVIKNVNSKEGSHDLLAKNKLSSKTNSVPEVLSCLRNSSQNDHKSVFSTPLLKEHFSKTLRHTSEVSKNMENSGTNNLFSQWKNSHLKRKSPINSFMYDSQLPSTKDNFSSDKSSNSIPSSVKSYPDTSKKRFYASMGLDEDLCDLNTKVKEHLPEPSSHQFLNMNMTCKNSTSVQDFLKQPIKKENVSPPLSPPFVGGNKNIQNSNNNLLLNDNMHISMTFEADPYDIDDEDDLPLSFFKCKSSGDENAETISKCQKNNKTENTACELLPTFIKKELIEEDEIVSVTDCNFPVSIETGLQKNIEKSSILNTYLTQNDKNLDFSPIKIKTEPTTEFKCSNLLSIDTVSEPLNQTLPNALKNLGEKTKSPKKNTKAKKRVTKKKNISKAGLHSMLIPVENEICENNLPDNLSVSFTLLESVNKKSPDKQAENVNLCDTLISPCLSGTNQTQSPKKVINKSKKSGVSKKNLTVKKKNAKKTPKQIFQTAQQTVTTSISIPDILKPQTDSMTENFDATFSDSSLNSTKNESPNKKIKKKTSKNDDNLDENLPITLLIKRQQSDSSIQSSDSFLCTTVRKPVFSESKIIDEKVKDNEKLNCCSPGPNNSTAFNTSLSLLGEVFQIKGTSQSIKNSNIEKCPKLKKSTQKKRTTKKGKTATGKGIGNEVIKNIYGTNFNSTLEPVSSPNASYSENSISSSNFNEDTCKMPNITNKDTPVQMEIEEEDSSSEESSTPLFNLKNAAAIRSAISNQLENAVSYVKNTKNKDDFIAEPGNQSGYTTPDTQLISSSGQGTPSSDVSFSTTNLDVGNKKKINEINLHPSESEKKNSPMKKKRQRKSHNWYKKKKYNTKKKLDETEILTTVSDPNLMTATVGFKEPVLESDNVDEEPNLLGELEETSDISENTNEKSTSIVNVALAAISKMPVVLVKNLESDKSVVNNKIDTNKISEQEDKAVSMITMNTEQNEPVTMITTNIEPEENIPVPAKRKRKKRAFGNSRKRKKVSNKNKQTQKKSIDAPETFEDSSTNTEIIEDSSTNTETIVDSDSTLVRSLDKDSENLPLVDEVSKESSEEAYIPFEELPVVERVTDIITITDSPIKPRNIQNKKFFPSLSVDTIQKDIEVLESFIAAEHNKVSKNNLVAKTSSQQEITQNSNLPSSSVTCIPEPTNSTLTSNLHKTSNVTNSFFKATSEQPRVKSIFNASLQKVKKEKSCEIIAQDNSILNLHDNYLVQQVSSNIQNEHINFRQSSITSRTEQASVNVVDRTELYASDASRTVSLLNKDTSSKSLNEVNKLNDTTELSIKKEALTKNQSASYLCRPVRNVNELNGKQINVQNSVANATQPNPKSIFNCSNSKTGNASTILPEPALHSNVEHMEDDEIVVIGPIPKIVPFVDLSDDEATVLLEENKSSYASDKFQAVQERTDNQLNISSATQHGSGLLQIPQNELDSSNNQNQIQPSSLDLGTEVSQDSNSFLDGVNNEFPDAEKKALDLLVVKEKYLHEYFRYPFPPSLPFHYRQKGKNKIYSRINSQSSTFTKEKVATRLRNSCNIKYQFGNKLGDIVKLEKYPVSASEVECYHRILTIAPSHDLLSKCFKASDTNEFKLYQEFGQSGNSNTSGNELPSHMICSLNDIIQGITESRIRSDNPENLDRNCPSVDTRDSLESHFSSVSDTSFVPNKEIMNFNNVLHGSKQSNFYQDISSNSQNTMLSAVITDLQNDTEMTDNMCITKNLEQTNSYLGTNEITDLQNNNCHSLPLKDSLDSIVSNSTSTEVISVVKSANDSIADIPPEVVKESLISDVTNSSADHSALPAMVPFPSQSPHVTSNEGSSLFQSTSNLIFDLDVPDLRKILEVATSFPVDSSNISKSNITAAETKSNVWESKETFEYNHTFSTPITEGNSKEENSDSISYSDKTCAIENPLNISNHDNERLDISDDDDDCVDNEPIGYESDFEKNETSDLQKDKKEDLKKDEEEHVIPEYKSKWEKIMERKALESKEKVNEHLLKECFPVSSKVLSKKLNVSKKDTKKCSKHKEVLNKDKSIKNKGISDYKSPNCKKKSHDSKKIKSNKGKIDKDSNADTKNKSKKAKDISKSSQVIVDDLFAPDIPVTKSPETKCDQKDKASKKFYGNRVTNRGTFLTESSDCVKTIKIPKKKNLYESKKLTSVRSEEFHSMVKSPNIHLESKSCIKPNANKSNILSSYQPKEIHTQDSFSSMQFSTTYVQPIQEYNQIPVHTTNLRDPRQADFQNRSLMQPRSLAEVPSIEMNKPVNIPIPTVPFYPNEEFLPNTMPPLLSTPPTFNLNDNPYLYKVPLLSTPPTVLKGPLENAPPMAFLQNILKSIKPTDSSMDGILPLPKTIISPSNNNNNPLPPFTPSFEELTNSSTHSEIISSSLLNQTYKTDLPVTNFNVQNTVQQNFAFQTQLNPSIVPQGLMSSNTTINQLLPQTTKKTFSTCLVPQDLKKKVGDEIIQTADVQLLMLEWSVDWLMQQQKNRNPPPISRSLKKVVSSYDNFLDHYNTYFPLMMLDTWHRIYVSWTHLSQASPYFCDITSYSVKSTYVNVECQTIFNTTAHPKGVFPDEGSILMIKYGTKSNDFTIKILGYVTNVKTRHFNHVTDSRLCNFKPPQDGNFDVFQVLTLSYMGAYNSEDIDKRLPVRIHVLCNVKPTLKQNDALLYIDKSPMLKSILNPIEDGELRSVSLPPRNSSQDVVNECVREISKGILSLHPLAQITVVRAVPQSDRLNIIPLLITKIKTVYKFKVLLCVRTPRALGDIAANICLHESLKLVIINKRCDTSSQFQKFLLDELVTAERKTKKQILKDCDVILSPIRNCHDEFMESTFRDTECVAQMCCIIDEANLCTEPETLIPILHGISKLILIGYPDYFAKVLSKTATSYDYNRSFFHRAHDLDLITE